MRSPADDEGMHREWEWMVPADVAILEFLEISRDRNGGYSIQTPKTISLNTPYGRKHVGVRCRTLADHGMVEKVERGQYRLSDYGEAALNGSAGPEDSDEGD